MPSEQPSASTVATDPAHTPLFSPRRRWKKPSSGPQPRVGGGNQRGPNPSPLGSPSSRSELKRTLRESAETAGLVLDLNAAKALRGSDASARPDGDNGDLERLGAVRVAVDVDHGAAQSLWSDADEVKLLAAAAAFRERTGRPPLRLDAGSLFDSIRDSVSPHFDEAMVYSKLMRFESKFSCGAPGSSITTHERRVHDLSTRVWGALDVVPLPEDDSCDQEANESYGDERRLITERSPMPAPPPCLDAPVPSERSSASSIGAGGAPALPYHDERRLITERAPMPALSPRLDMPSPSERSSASSMDTDAAPTLPCLDERRLTTQRAPLPALSPRIDAPMLSERSSAFSMDANAAHTPPSSHSSKKRSLSPLLGMGDGHLDPSSSPCGSPSRRLRISTESTVVTLAAAAAAAAAATLWSDVDGGHEDVQSPESTGVAVDLGRGDVQGLQPSDGGCHGVAPNYPKRWSDAEEVTLLAAAAFFRERTGWRKNGRLIETRWRKQFDGEMKTQMRWHDLAKEICGLLNDTIKGLGT